MYKPGDIIKGSNTGVLYLILRERDAGRKAYICRRVYSKDIGYQERFLNDELVVSLISPMSFKEEVLIANLRQERPELFEI